MRLDIQYRLSQSAIRRIPPREPMSRKGYLHEMLDTLDSQEIEQVIKRVEPIYHGTLARRPG